MSEIEFNLLDEPWIKVMTEDCTSQEISLTQALWEGHHYRRLAGDTGCCNSAPFAGSATHGFLSNGFGW
jgi:hypothetical protein